MDTYKKNDKLRAGIIGLGCRGDSMTELLAEREDLEITAVCDIYDDRVSMMQEKLAAAGHRRPVGFTDHSALISSPLTDIIFIFAAWEAHVPAAVEAMRAGKPVAFEVGGAYTLDDCRILIDTYLLTHTPIMMLENCMYAKKEMTVAEMHRAGVFGEIMHLDGGYMHDLRSEISGGERNRHYRLRNYLGRCCENYPTHELGPICRLLGINEDNRFLTLSSFATASRGLNDYAARTEGVDKKLADAEFAQGDIVTTILTTTKGQTVRLTLDTTLARPYSRGLTVHGTRGFFCEDNLSVYTDSDNTEADHFRWRKFWGNFDEWTEKYQPQLWRDYSAAGIKKGHGGMDFLVLDAFMTSVKEGLPMPLDVFDAAVLMAVTPLSELSIKNGGAPVSFPDLMAEHGVTAPPRCTGKYALHDLRSGI